MRSLAGGACAPSATMFSPQGTGTIVAASVSSNAIPFWTTEVFYYHEHDDATHKPIRVTLRR